MARILVVEDSSELRELIVLLLQEEGHDVVSAPSISHARAELARGHFDLVATDLSADDPAGPSQADREWLREASRLAPVLVLTGRAWTPRVAPSDLGVARIIFKPFDLAMLVATIADLLDARA